MKHRCPKCGARWSWIGCGCFRAAAIVAALLLLPAIIQADAPGDRQRSPATLHETRRPRPMLKVWGCDHHAACQRFAADYRTLPQFRDALESRFDVRFVNVHGPLRLNLAGASAGITHCPTFEPLDRAARIEGYRDPDTLLQALGLPAIAPSRGTIVAPGDAAATPPPAMPDPTAAPGEAVPDVHAQAAAQLRAEFERLQQWAAEHTTATSEQIAEHRRVLEIIAKRIDDDGTPAELEQLRRQLAILSAQLEAPRAAPPVARSPAPLPQGPATGSPP
ncbi:MAG: hypothetical protein R3B90_21810 [Planctomycetaceae bacterium]